MTLAVSSRAFLEYLDGMLAGLRPASMQEIVRSADGPEHVALMCTDVINGFCTQGPLSSPRVNSIVQPICSLLSKATEQRVTRILQLCDTHSPDAAEFAQYAPHCIVDTEESQLVPELAGHPAAVSYRMVRKNSISAWFGTSLPGIVQSLDAAEVTTIICVGDCTDICVYQLALPLKVRANAANRALRVIVPADCVQTFDLPVDVAVARDLTPHDGDLLHAVFLYHMRLNGVEVVSSISD